jgi:hypothetical protein
MGHSWWLAGWAGAEPDLHGATPRSASATNINRAGMDM